MIFAIALALTILAPRSGERVSTLKDVQKDFLSADRDERFRRMDNAADRERFLRAGARQQSLRIAWTNAAPIVTVSIVRSGSVPSEICVTNRSEIWVTNLELDGDYVVRVSDQKGACEEVRFATESTPPRLLRAEGVANFRDLGGWKTSDGRRVRQNLILRSAGLRSSSKAEGSFLRQKITPGVQRVSRNGIETLKGEFGVRTDLELRTPQETAGMATTLLSPAKWVNVSFAAYDFIDNPTRGREPFVRIFRVFTRRENYPILMHCSGGRDRTGTLAFLLNGLLGVAEDDLIRDWEMSIFSDDGASFSSGRIQGFLSYLNCLPGETLKERIEFYVRSCGIREDEILAFREIMLEGGKQ